MSFVGVYRSERAAAKEKRLHHKHDSAMARKAEALAEREHSMKLASSASMTHLLDEAERARRERAEHSAERDRVMRVGASVP